MGNVPSHPDYSYQHYPDSSNQSQTKGHDGHERASTSGTAVTAQNYEVIFPSPRSSVIMSPQQNSPLMASTLETSMHEDQGFEGGRGRGAGESGRIEGNGMNRDIEQQGTRQEPTVTKSADKGKQHESQEQERTWSYPPRRPSREEQVRINYPKESIASEDVNSSNYIQQGQRIPPPLPPRSRSVSPVRGRVSQPTEQAERQQKSDTSQPSLNVPPLSTTRSEATSQPLPKSTEDLEKKVQVLGNDIKLLTSYSARLESTVAHLQSRLAETRTENQQLRERIELLSSQVAFPDSTQSKQLERLRSQVKQLESDLNDERARHLEGHFGVFEEKRLKGVIRHLEEENYEMEERLRHALQEVKELKRRGVEGRQEGGRGRERAFGGSEMDKMIQRLIGELHHALNMGVELRELDQHQNLITSHLFELVSDHIPYQSSSAQNQSRQSSFFSNSSPFPTPSRGTRENEGSVLKEGKGKSTSNLKDSGEIGEKEKLGQQDAGFAKNNQNREAKNELGEKGKAENGKKKVQFQERHDEDEDRFFEKGWL
ncbi:hypothetical protein BKA69DRAFT_1165668 [Paraphysoderma sedebokerense]|nr:hypothetical protein BKA69DRAFT_1165668 [Paraphysoderma sedebokerense]